MGQTTRYLIKPDDRSTFTLEVYKTGFLKGKKHIFHFESYEGEALFSPDDLASAQITFSVDAGSLVLKDNWVKQADQNKIEALAKEEILGVASHPKLRFESTKVTRTLGEYSLRGNLTIKNTQKPVFIEVTLGPNQTDHLQIDGNSHIKLSDYGLKPPSAFLGAVGTKDIMSVRFSLIAVPAP